MGHPEKGDSCGLGWPGLSPAPALMGQRQCWTHPLPALWPGLQERPHPPTQHRAKNLPAQPVQSGPALSAALKKEAPRQEAWEEDPSMSPADTPGPSRTRGCEVQTGSRLRENRPSPSPPTLLGGPSPQPPGLAGALGGALRPQRVSPPPSSPPPTLRCPVLSGRLLGQLLQAAVDVIVILRRLLRGEGPAGGERGVSRDGSPAGLSREELTGFCLLLGEGHTRVSRNQPGCLCP